MTIGTDTRGVYAIAPTPFQPDGTLDTASLDRMVDFYEAAGVDGLTILGIMGEAPKLDARRGARDRLPHRQAHPPPRRRRRLRPGLRRHARPSPAPRWTSAPPAVMIAPVPSLRTDDQIAAYFAQAGEAIGPDIPWVLQDYPLTLIVADDPRASSAASSPTIPPASC